MPLDPQPDKFEFRFPPALDPSGYMASWHVDEAEYELQFHGKVLTSRWPLLTAADVLAEIARREPGRAIDIPTALSSQEYAASAYVGDPIVIADTTGVLGVAKPNGEFVRLLGSPGERFDWSPGAPAAARRAAATAVLAAADPYAFAQGTGGPIDNCVERFAATGFPHESPFGYNMRGLQEWLTAACTAEIEQAVMGDGAPVHMPLAVAIAIDAGMGVGDAPSAGWDRWLNPALWHKEFRFDVDSFRRALGELRAKVDEDAPTGSRSRRPALPPALQPGDLQFHVGPELDPSRFYTGRWHSDQGAYELRRDGTVLTSRWPLLTGSDLVAEIARREPGWEIGVPVIDLVRQESDASKSIGDPFIVGDTTGVLGLAKPNGEFVRLLGSPGERFDWSPEAPAAVRRAAATAVLAAADPNAFDQLLDIVEPSLTNACVEQFAETVFPHELPFGLNVRAVIGWARAAQSPLPFSDPSRYHDQLPNINEDSFRRALGELRAEVAKQTQARSRPGRRKLPPAHVFGPPDQPGDGRYGLTM